MGNFSSSAKAQTPISEMSKTRKAMLVVVVVRFDLMNTILV